MESVVAGSYDRFLFGFQCSTSGRNEVRPSDIQLQDAEDGAAVLSIRPSSRSHNTLCLRSDLLSKAFRFGREIIIIGTKNKCQDAMVCRKGVSLDLSHIRHTR